MVGVCELNEAYRTSYYDYLKSILSVIHYCIVLFILFILFILYRDDGRGTVSVAYLLIGITHTPVYERRNLNTTDTSSAILELRVVYNTSYDGEQREYCELSAHLTWHGK